MDMLQTAQAFFDACETGKGWDGCKEYCTDTAGFAAQAGATTGIDTLEGYCEWMKGMLSIMPDAHYELKSFAMDTERNVAIAYAIFHGTHTGEGGPMPPTGKTTASDYVYHMEMNDAGQINNVVKIWNDGMAMVELGWA